MAKNESDNLEFYRTAQETKERAEAGEADAQFDLAEMYREYSTAELPWERLKDGVFVPPLDLPSISFSAPGEPCDYYDMEKCTHWLEEASYQDNISAQCMLGYITGLRNERDDGGHLTKEEGGYNWENSVYWLQQAAQNPEHADGESAIYWLSEMYGVGPNDNEELVRECLDNLDLDQYFIFN